MALEGVVSPIFSAFLESEDAVMQSTLSLFNSLGEHTQRRNTVMYSRYTKIYRKSDLRGSTRSTRLGTVSLLNTKLDFYFTCVLQYL